MYDFFTKFDPLNSGFCTAFTPSQFAPDKRHHLFPSISSIFLPRTTRCHIFRKVLAQFFLVTRHVKMIRVLCFRSIRTTLKEKLSNDISTGLRNSILVKMKSFKGFSFLLHIKMLHLLHVQKGTLNLPTHFVLFNWIPISENLCCKLCCNIHYCC